jgi:hypothetical protein
MAKAYPLFYLKTYYEKQNELRVRAGRVEENLEYRIKRSIMDC